MEIKLGEKKYRLSNENSFLVDEFLSSIIYSRLGNVAPHFREDEGWVTSTMFTITYSAEELYRLICLMCEDEEPSFAEVKKLTPEDGNEIKKKLQVVITEHDLPRRAIDWLAKHMKQELEVQKKRLQSQSSSSTDQTNPISSTDSK